MSIIIHREAAVFGGELGCAVTAIVEPATLPKLRQQLQPFQGLSVVVSQASIWGSKRQGSYRGARVLLDQPVSRVEIACQEQDIDAVLRAIHRACAAEQAVPAQSLGSAPSSAMQPSGIS